MIPAHFKTLIEKLKVKTVKDKAIWTKTSRDNEFKLDLGQGAITINSWENGNFSESADITVINDRGDSIDRFFADAGEADYKFLFELHTLAKRSYYKVDETFNNIFKELDSEKTIGTERKDEDFPF